MDPRIRGHCSACARLGLPCQYQVRLKWGNEATEQSLVGANFFPLQRLDGSSVHFVNFTVDDLSPECASDPDGYGGKDCMDDVLALDSPGFTPGDASFFLSPVSSASTLSLPSLVDEPSWFPPLEIPSDLDEMLFMYYAIEICPRCTMYDDSSNGFRSIIIPMSAAHPSVMHSILAVAAFYQRQRDPEFEIVALEQKENALVHIRREFQRQPERTHEELIATAIMLCVFEIKDGSGPNWNKHLHGGRSILQSRVRGPGSQIWGDGIAWWANKFFGYQSINGASTSQQEESRLLQEPEFWLSQGLGVQDIDGFMGCSSEMMSITARISALIRATYEENLPDGLLDHHASQLERCLFEIQQHCPHLPATMGERISATTGNNSLQDMIAAFLHHPTVRARAKILALTAEARRQAALVLLHLCARRVPVWRGEVQSRVSSCLVCVGAVAQLMAAADAPVWGMTPLVWPLFIAGAAAVREEDRFRIADVFAKLRVSKCLGNVERAESVVKSIWKQHDMAGSDGDRLELWRLYVNPNPKWPLSLG